MSKSSDKPKSPAASASDEKLSRREAKRLLKETGRLLRKSRKRLSDDSRARLEKAMSQLSEALSSKSSAREISVKAQELDSAAEEILGFTRKGGTREFFESITFAVLIAVFLRAFVIEAFKIPSASMYPTLEVGDHIFVNKFIYGLRVPFTNLWFAQWDTPEHGDVIVFRYPLDQSKDYIKRTVAVAGDAVRVEGRTVFINGVELERGEAERRQYVEDAEPGSELRFHNEQSVFAYAESSLGDPSTDYTVLYRVMDVQPPFPMSGTSFPGLDCTFGHLEKASGCTVKEGFVFVMGDNRDNSSDSRAWGAVPVDLVKGKALFIWWSRGARDGVRWGRMGQPIH